MVDDRRRRGRVRAVTDLGTFRLAGGDLVRCRLDAHGRIVAERETDGRRSLVDGRIVIDAVKLSDDPTWLDEDRERAASILLVD